MKRQFFNFLLLLGFYTMTAQSGSITGSVTDSNSNEPLPGVNVIVLNTTNGTNTDFNGNFSLDNVNTGDVLVFSYLGFKTLEYTVSDSFNLSLLETRISANKNNSNSLFLSLNFTIAYGVPLELFFS